MSYQPRYLAYARARRSSPDGLFEKDGGNNAGFMCWMGGRIAEFQKLRADPKACELHPEEFTAYCHQHAEANPLP